jgi:hypothetical protein
MRTYQSVKWRLSSCAMAAVQAAEGLSSRAKQQAAVRPSLDAPLQLVQP